MKNYISDIYGSIKDIYFKHNANVSFVKIQASGRVYDYLILIDGISMQEFGIIPVKYDKRMNDLRIFGIKTENTQDYENPDTIIIWFSNKDELLKLQYNI